MKRTCKQCGKEFELSESEVSFYKRKGLELPKRCQTCRNQNKEMSGYTQKADKERNAARPDTVSGSGSNNGGNNKSYIAIAIAAAVMLLTVFFVKGCFTQESENLLASGDAAASGRLLEQDAADKPFPAEPEITQQSSVEEVEAGGQTTEQKSQPSENKDEEQTETRQTASQDEKNEEVQTQQEVQTKSLLIVEVPNITYQFRKAQYLTEHFEKHGEEFPYATEEEYLQGANNVIKNPDALHKLEAEDGDDVYYVESTNEFVVVSTDGYIRTYFKASMDYYNRQ